MIKKVSVIEVTSKTQAGNVTVIDIPKERLTGEDIIRKAEKMHGKPLNHFEWCYKYCDKWYRIDSDTFRNFGIQCDKKLVGMHCHTKRIYFVKFHVPGENGETITICRSFTDKIRRRDLKARFKELLLAEGSYEFATVESIKIMDLKYWLTPEQILKYGTDVTEAVEAVR